MRVPPIVASALLAAFVGGSVVPAALASREVVVHFTKSGFSPRSSTIVVGDRVRFTVRDHKNHQLWKKTGSQAGDVPPNILEGQGGSVTLAPTEPGTYEYVDRLSPKNPSFKLTVRPR